MHVETVIGNYSVDFGFTFAFLSNRQLSLIATLDKNVQYSVVVEVLKVVSESDLGSFDAVGVVVYEVLLETCVV